MQESLWTTSSVSCATCDARFSVRRKIGLRSLRYFECPSCAGLVSLKSNSLPVAITDEEVIEAAEEEDEICEAQAEDGEDDEEGKSEISNLEWEPDGDVERAVIDPAQRIADLNSLLEISRRIGEEKDLDALLNLIMNETTRLLKTDRSSLFLYDEANHEIYTKIAQRAEVKQIRVPVGKGISGMVAQIRRVWNIEDAYDCPYFDRSWDKITGYRTKSVLCSPIFTREGNLVGVIQVLNRLDGKRFDSYDEELLYTLTSHAAAALANASLLAAFLDGQKMKKALEVASDIQMSLLPRKAPDFPGYELAGYSTPCDEAGGDYYDYVEIDEHRLLIAVGDVTGHGVGAALLMATGRALLRAFSIKSLDLPDTLFNMNNALERDMGAERFMTLFIGVLDRRTGELVYSSAGHDPPMVLRKSSGEFFEMESTGLPLGMVEDTDFPFGDSVILEPGDLISIATDGVWEAMDKTDEEYGQERLQAVLRKAAEKPAEKVIDAVYDDVRAFCKEIPFRDDFTLVILKRNV
ncbi:MAG: SpoIIE family protein phosphatase [Planctomycetes bacterium]|nr:SpoIIE family protein phosphatase [Planctomycetota bacterium]